MHNFTITKEEMERAEKDIFGSGGCFNGDQKEFIKCLDSCCVQAYAGTGKTTSIVGRLHILAQKNVWENGRGICVISHTNVAVDEIKKHVAKHYPAIMQYPNFVGTIQEFINKFLFIPYLASQGLQIKFQDESRFFDYKSELPKNIVERIDNHIKSKVNHRADPERARKEFFSRLGTVYFNDDKLYARERHDGLAEFTELKTGTVSQSEISGGFKDLIKKKQGDGHFLFVESFAHGREYIKQNSILKNIICQRFQFVFLDEAQDCSKIQSNMLKELFGDDPRTTFQQIGDVNQAISETEWSPGDNFLSLSQSTRFGNNIAEFINKFQTSGGVGVSGTKEDTKKRLIIYEAGEEKEVLKKFSEMLKREKIPTDKGFFAISHRHEQIEKYFLGYSKVIAKNKNKKTSYHFDRDIEYINLLTKDSVRERGSNFISKILFSLLYKHFKTDGNSRSELKNYLRTSGKIDDFKKMVLEVSSDVLKNDSIFNLDDLSSKLNVILCKNKINFYADGISPSSTPAQKQSEENKFYCDGVSINIGTIHSVKGQTHGATLLFSNKEEGKQDIQHNTEKLGPKFKKRIYVASSRPKYLFAVAIETSAYNKLTDTPMFKNFVKI